MTPVNNPIKDSLFKKYNLDKIQLLPNFQIAVYAEVPNARSMVRGEKGTIFVGNRDEDNVYAIVDKNGDQFADTIYTIAKNLNTPCGVAFKNGSLYVATISEILRYDDIENKLATPPAPVKVFSNYPTETHHGWKYISFGPDGKLYVPVGAPCNVCEKTDKPVYASITRLNADGTGMEVFANGVRNSVGFDWHPETKELWFTDNGRDMLGNDLPADELNRAPQAGLHFGFPYCHQGDTPDPEFGKKRKCDEFIKPARNLTPHGAALGMRFYTGNMFPTEYKNQIFIAEHGSWNRTTPIGYRIMCARLQGNNVSDYVSFASGWLQNGKAIGRPSDVMVMPDGALLVSDDLRGAIYRISYKK